MFAYERWFVLFLLTLFLCNVLDLYSLKTPENQKPKGYKNVNTGQKSVNFTDTKWIQNYPESIPFSFSSEVFTEALILTKHIM